MHGADGEPDFAQIVATLRARVSEPRAGLYGPSSMTWKLLREPALLLGGGRALLLQIAHPAVAAAVEEHSDFRQHPFARAERTFSAMFRIAFADLDGALTAAAQVHGRHASVRGTIATSGKAYRASDPELLLWVHATLVDTVLEVYPRMIAPLSGEDAERYYQEQRTTAFLLGVPEEIQPPDLASFRRWFASIVDGGVLRVGEVARAQCRDLLAQPPSTALRAMLGRDARLPALLDALGLGRASTRLARLLTAGLLPSRLRAPFGFSWSSLDARAFAAVTTLTRTIHGRLPSSLRTVPAFGKALARATGASSLERGS